MTPAMLPAMIATALASALVERRARDDRRILGVALATDDDISTVYFPILSLRANEPDPEDDTLFMFVDWSDELTSPELGAIGPCVKNLFAPRTDMEATQAAAFAAFVSAMTMVRQCAAVEPGVVLFVDSTDPCESTRRLGWEAFQVLNPDEALVQRAKPFW